MIKSLVLAGGLILGLVGIIRAQPIQWPNGAKAAICLTYDDAMTSQLETALPALETVRLPATFFLPAIYDAQSAESWRKAARSGHELANHTLYHACLGRGSGKPEWSLENYTIDRILKEIAVMNSMLYLLDGKSAVRSFAFPCGDTTVGGVSYLDTLRRSGLVQFARSGGSADSIITNFATLNPMQVPSWGVPANTTADALIDFAGKAARQGGLGVYMFHGVGSQWIAVSAEEHKKLLSYLAQHRQQYWVTTFTKALAYAAQWQKNHR